MGTLALDLPKEGGERPNGDAVVDVFSAQKKSRLAGREAAAASVPPSLGRWRKARDDQ